MQRRIATLERVQSRWSRLFIVLFLVLGRVEGLLGKTFFAVRGAQWKDLLRSNYIQLESSVNSANLRKNIAICARVVSAQFC